LEKDIGLHAEHLKHLEDVPFMIEMAVESVRHEQSERKRALYPVLFVNLLLDRPQTSRDERIAMLEALDTLTDADLEVLVQFTRAGWSTGDILSQTFHAGFSSMRDDQVLNDKYEEQLGPFITSTAKLEGRGLIIPTIRIAEFHSTGKEGAWYNQFRRKAWKLLPLGRKLLIAALS
jgi:hypothetical protein